MSEDKKKQEDTQKKPDIVDFYQNQYKRAIWKARVRRHRRG